MTDHPVFWIYDKITVFTSMVCYTILKQTQGGNPMKEMYDLIVIGGGPGGYLAAEWAADATLETGQIAK